MTQITDPKPRKPIRLWPGLVAVVALLGLRFGVKAVVEGFGGFALAMQWALGAAAAVILWWLLLSRARWLDRLAGIGVMAAGMAMAWFLRHDSMGPIWAIAYALPVLCLALVSGAVATRHMPDRRRRAWMAAIILGSSAAWTVLRMDGISGDHDARFRWRWTKSAEERLLASAPSAPLPAPVEAPKPVEKPATPVPAAADVKTAETAKPAAAGTAKPADPEMSRIEWPGFRGPNRDSVIRGVRIETDWSKAAPAEIWRRPIGPGWGSFAVHGDRLYTQEQRGDDEIVACYDAKTGAPVWMHGDRARFFEANAGPGPRGTPTLHGSRVYTLGATGIVNALDAATGKVVWSRNAATDTGTEIPTWGFSGSPLVVGDVVVIAFYRGTIAYERDTGRQRWIDKAGGGSYSSPHLVAIGGVPQILFVGGAGTTSVEPASGTRLWEHGWRGAPIVQPALMDGGDVFIAASADSGTRRLAVTRGSNGWKVEEKWTSRGLKPYFNDFVIHQGHAYGFDARILASVNVEDGERKWKGGRYGNGQLLLLADQDVMLVLSEEGELALVSATPNQFTELARFKAIEGKTWNHPVLVGDVLYVRNGDEMAAFRLRLAGGTTEPTR